jgi:hypothetical protein
VPAEWDQWPSTVQESILRRRDPGDWYLLVKGIAADNGYGDPIDASRAGQITQAFRPPLCFAQVHTAGFYDDAGFCQDCDAPYCYRHWHVTESGYGYCPRGHGKSLDPHWSPLRAGHRRAQPRDLFPGAMLEPVSGQRIGQVPVTAMHRAGWLAHHRR